MIHYATHNTIVLFLALIVYEVSIYAWVPQAATSPPTASSASFELRASSPSSSAGEETRHAFLFNSLTSCLGLLMAPLDNVAAAETVGKDPDCNDITCLGVWVSTIQILSLTNN